MPVLLQVATQSLRCVFALRLNWPLSFLGIPGIQAKASESREIHLVKPYPG